MSSHSLFKKCLCVFILSVEKQRKASIVPFGYALSDAFLLDISARFFPE